MKSKYSLLKDKKTLLYIVDFYTERFLAIRENMHFLAPKIVRSSEGLEMVVCGDNQTVKLSGDDANEQLLFIEQHDEPGLGIPLHIHENEDEIFHILEGEVEVTVGEQTTVLRKADIGFCPRKVPPTWRLLAR